MGSISTRKTKDGSISWRASIRIKNYPSMDKTFKTKKEAEVWIETTESAIRSQSGIPYLTLNQFLDRMEIDILPKKNPKYAQNEKSYMNFWREHLGNKIATEITSDEIEMKANLLYSMKSRFDKPFSPETRRKYVQTLTYLYNVAIKHWKWAVTNPAATVDLHLQAIKDTQGKVKEKIPISVKEFKEDFLWVLEGQLKILGIPNHPGVELSRLSGLSKTSLQHIYSLEDNCTLSNLLKLAQSTGISFNAVATSTPDVSHDTK